MGLEQFGPDIQPVFLMPRPDMKWSWPQLVLAGMIAAALVAAFMWGYRNLGPFFNDLF